jgi:hypothetical protein
MTGKSYYERRMKELSDLLRKAKSNTSKTLIEEAIQLTKTSFSEYLRISNIADERIKFYDDAMLHFNNTMSTAKENIAKMYGANEMFSDDTKSKIVVAADAMMEDLTFHYERRKLANRSVRDAIEFCNEELSKTLLELVYKPDPTSFTFDAAAAILKKIAEGWIPYSDKAEMILELSISRRKTEYLSSGDKLMSYLEDYISVLQTMIALMHQFEKDVLKKD